MSDDDKMPKMVEKIVKIKADSNRRYIDEVLEKIQDSNREFYLAKFADELKEKEAAEKAGDLHKARHHEVMAETYKAIAENSFPA